MRRSETLASTDQPSRPDLADRTLKRLVGALLVCLIGYLVLRLWIADGWPDGLSKPGSPFLQSCAIVGSLLLLAPFVFSYRKRAGSGGVPNRLFIVHVAASLAGTALVCLHAFVSLTGPPLFMLLALLVLIVSGTVARVRLSRSMAATLGTKLRTFAAPDPALKTALRELIQTKRDLLTRLDPDADEALFSVTLRHWLKAPSLSMRYTRLAQRESALIGARRSVGRLQAWWRPLHLGFAWLFLLALAAHVIVVVFFAGYAADGAEIYWWHLSDEPGVIDIRISDAIAYAGGK